MLNSIDKKLMKAMWELIEMFPNFKERIILRQIWEEALKRLKNKEKI